MNEVCAIDRMHVMICIYARLESCDLSRYLQSQQTQHAKTVCECMEICIHTHVNVHSQALGDELHILIHIHCVSRLKSLICPMYPFTHEFIDYCSHVFIDTDCVSHLEYSVSRRICDCSSICRI